MTDVRSQPDALAAAGGGVITRRPRPRRVQARAERRFRMLSVTLGAGVPIVLLLLWQFTSTAGWIDPRLYPAPTVIWTRAQELATNGTLGTDTWITFKRVLEGWALGLVTGAPLGALMGTIRLVRRALEPTLNALYVVPKLALLPVFLTIFGLGEAPVVVLNAVTVFFFVWIAALEAFAQLPAGYRETATSLQLTRRRTFTAVLLPAVLPQLFTGMTVAMNVAILVDVAAEFVVGDSGLGYMINNGRQLFLNDQMYVGIVCVALLGVLLSAVVSWVGRRLTPWTRA